MPEENEETVKRQRAVALQYTYGDGAPRVVASGAGEIARRILQLAEENQIPVQQDDSLVSILSKLDLGYEIPAETYRVVAEILAFLYRTDIAYRQKKQEQGLKVPLPKERQVLDNSLVPPGALPRPASS